MHSSTPPSPQPASPLLRLPGEIRNRIYHYIYSGQQILFPRQGFTTISFPYKPLRGKRTTQPSPSHHPLALVCRQLHAETALLPFLLGTILLHNIQTLAELDNRLTASQCSAIQHLRLITPLWYSNIVPLFIRNSRRRGKTGLRDFLPGLKGADVVLLMRYMEKDVPFRGWSPRGLRRKEWFEGWLREGRGRDFEVRFQGWGQEDGGK